MSNNSRPSKTSEWDYDFFVDFDATNGEQVSQVSKILESLAKQVHIVGTGGVSDHGELDSHFFHRVKNRRRMSIKCSHGH